MTQYDISSTSWITSRACNNSACVQVAYLPDGLVALRDSKDTAKQAHVFDRQEWAAFIAGVKAGDFDLPS
jgi:Domain of unknown function (DUF397)